MKKILLILLTLLVIVCLFMIFGGSPQNLSNAPRYLAVQTQPTGGLGSEHYGWDDPIPFRDGKVWLFTVLSRSNHHNYFYDIENRKVLGELFKGGVVLASKDQTKLLCAGESFTSGTVKDRFFALLNGISFGKLKLRTNRADCYWFLDTKNNSAKHAGALSQFAGTGSTWCPSPGFRFGFNVPSNSEEGKSFFLCDLESDTFEKIKFKGKLYNWWSNHEILISDSGGNFLLFDVLTGKTSTLFTTDALAKCCRDFGLPEKRLHPLSCWNGSNFDYYFSDAIHWGDRTGSVLLKVDKTVPSLRVFSTNFEFHWLGWIHENGRYYVYSGESAAPGRGGNGAVYVHDLANNTNNTLVPPDNSGQYALARFYSNSVIYSKNRTLWRIDLNGSNNARLFAPNAPK